MTPLATRIVFSWIATDVEKYLGASASRGSGRSGYVGLVKPASMGDAADMNTSSESISVRLRRSAKSLGPIDYAATLALLAVYVIGTSLDDGPNTSIDFYRSVATVIPTLLITVAIQGRFFELSRKVTFRLRYRTVLFAVVVFGGEAGTLMTIAREKTNWAAHLYVYLAVLALGLATIYLALTGPEQPESAPKERGSGDCCSGAISDSES